MNHFRVPLGQVCNEKNCKEYEIGYFKKCYRNKHSFKPNGELEEKKQ